MNRHILLDKLTASIASLASGKHRFFSDNIDSASLRENLYSVSIQEFDLTPGIHELNAKTLVGELDPAFNAAQLKGTEYPTIIYHHGNNERPFDFSRFAKNSFKSIFYDTDESIEANLIAVRAPFHNSTLKAYQRKISQLSNFAAMLMTSVKLVQELILVLKREYSGPVLVSGISLGGWVTNLHRTYYNSADAYVPLLAGAALDELFITSGYRKLAGEPAVQHPEQIRKILNFENDFQQITDDNVFPLLGRFDRYIEYERQKVCYGDRPIKVLETGHVTSLLAADKLREYIVEHL
ncbi:abhydrolase domain-containing 18 [candidate division KSB1 bacterium]|nr:abhydrolase domain-containing 18 [candidate division KSB1 bacterium]